ncbi:MAG: ComEC/Rec2 family competence protein [Bacteroidetes bacterium]|nr:ComEC/Rec2 family competence protein [Bacteroidota bacterium]
MKSQHSSVLLPLLCFIAGIGVDEVFVFGVLFFIAATYLLLYFCDKVKFSKDTWGISIWSLIIGVLFFFLGRLNVEWNSPTGNPISDKVNYDSLQIKITDGLKFTERGCWTIAPAFNGANSFDVLLNLDSARGSSLQKGDTLLLRAISALPIIKAGKEPSKWDQYLLRQGIRAKIYIGGKTKLELKKNQSYLYLFYNLTHQKIISSSLSQKSKSLLLSLLIGDRGYVDKKTKEDYAVLGVSHILSVSGLHVGIIYIIISGVISLLLSKRSVLAVSVVLLLIWFYCWMVGFSPPVLRSALMFSLFVVGKSMGRKSALLHTTCLSAFVILLVNPLYLYDIGFQLTYAAMLGIIFVMPVFSEKWKVTNFVLKSVLDLVFLSVAVQITLLPFLIYYFEYLSVYFVVANLVIVPAVALLMYCGIVYVLLPVNDLLIYLLDSLVLFMDKFCEVLCNWPFTTFPIIVSSAVSWMFYAFGIVFLLQYRYYRLNAFLYCGCLASFCFFLSL